MITLKRYLLTLVALLAMTTGAWAQQTTVTWDTETWASGWTSDVKTHTVDGVTITVSGSANAKNSSGNLYIYVDNSASNTLTFSADIPIARIEMTKAFPSSSLNVSPLDGWSVSSDNTTVIWEGTATKSLVCKTCTLTVTKIKFFLEEPLIALNDTKTVATMAAMPAYDATVSYELVRDLTVQTQFFGIPTETVFVKKDGDKFVFADGVPTVALLDLLNENAPILDGAYYYFEKKNAETGEFEASTVDLLTDAQPGTWRIVTSATDGGPYDGTVRSAEFTLAEAYDLTLSPATDAHLNSVTVAGTAKTADENGVIRGIEPTKKVKITTTGPDYIIRKATVKKAGAAATALSPALVNGATIEVVCESYNGIQMGGNFTYNDGVFTRNNFVGNDLYFDQMKATATVSGTTITIATGIGSYSSFDHNVTLNTSDDTYTLTGGSSIGSVISVKVNGVEILDKLTEEK